MSKSNVNPNHYKVAGRERQGEDIAQVRNKQTLSESLVRQRYEAGAVFQQPAPVTEAAPPAAASVPAAKETARKPTATGPVTAKRAARKQVAAKRATKKRATAKPPVTKARVKRAGAKRAKR